MGGGSRWCGMVATVFVLVVVEEMSRKSAVFDDASDAFSCRCRGAVGTSSPRRDQWSPDVSNVLSGVKDRVDRVEAETRSTSAKPAATTACSGPPSAFASGQS